MDDQVLNLRDLVLIIRRHLRLVLALTLLGLVLGLGYATLKRPMPSAQSIVLLPPQSSGVSGQSTLDPATEVVIAQSEAVVDPAAAKVGLRLSYPVLRRRVAVTALTTDSLQIMAQASTGRLAEDFANAIAAQFVAYSGTTVAQSKQALIGLEQQSARLNHELATIQKQVTAASNLLAGEKPGSASAQSTRQLIASLQGDEDSVSLEIVQIAQATASAPASAGGVVILQRATTTVPPSRWRIPMAGGSGAVCGFALGGLVAFVVDRRDRRLRRRDDIALVAEAPVLQSLSPERPDSVHDWLDLFRSWYPDATNRARLRKVLDDLDIPPERQTSQTKIVSTQRRARTRRDELHQSVRPFDLTVIALAGDRHGLTVAAELGVFAATIGLSVAFVVGTDHESTKTLRTACAARDRRKSAPGRDLLTYERPIAQRARTALTVTLVVADPKLPEPIDWSFDPPSGTSRAKATVLAVSSGFAVAEDITVLSKSAARASHPVAGVVVANPDPTDKTTGLFPPATDQRTPRRFPPLRNVAR